MFICQGPAAPAEPRFVLRILDASGGLIANQPAASQTEQVGSVSGVRTRTIEKFRLTVNGVRPFQRFGPRDSNLLPPPAPVLPAPGRIPSPRRLPTLPSPAQPQPSDPEPLPDDPQPDPANPPERTPPARPPQAPPTTPSRPPVRPPNRDPSRRRSPPPGPQQPGDPNRQDEPPRDPTRDPTRQPTEFGNDGRPLQLPPPGPVQTPEDEIEVEGERIGQPGFRPPATMVGIASELGRIEQKVERLLRPSLPDEGEVDLGPVLERLEDLEEKLEELTRPLRAEFEGSEYELWPVCDRDSAGQLREALVSSWQGGEGKLVELGRKLDALAELLQFSKDLRQPICRSRPRGEEVSVNFREVP